MHGKSPEAVSGYKVVVDKPQDTKQYQQYVIEENCHILRIITDIYLTESTPKWLTELDLWDHTDEELGHLRRILERRGLKQPTPEILEEWRDAINLA